MKGRDWRYAEAIAGYKFEQRYRKGDMMTVPDALSRVFAAYHEVMGDTGVWHEVEHGKREVIKVTTPSKLSIPLNQDLTLVAAVEQDLWHKIVGVYAMEGVPALKEQNFDEDDNILPDAILVPQQIQLKESYKRG